MFNYRWRIKELQKIQEKIRQKEQQLKMLELPTCTLFDKDKEELIKNLILVMNGTQYVDILFTKYGDVQKEYIKQLGEYFVSVVDYDDKRSEITEDLYQLRSLERSLKCELGIK